MKPRRALAFFACLLVSACTTPSAPPPPPPSPSAAFDPRAALTAATSGIDTGIYAYQLTLPGGARSTGALHKPSRSAAFTITTRKTAGRTGTLSVRNVGPGRYLKLDYPRPVLRTAIAEIAAWSEVKEWRAPWFEKQSAEIDRGTWWRFDLSAPAEDHLTVYFDEPDVLQVKRMLAGAVDLGGGPAKITGKLDATAIGTEEPLVGADINKRSTKADLHFQMINIAESVPFAVTLDAQGRLSKLVLTMPALRETPLPAGPWTMTFSSYGETSIQTVPPAKQVRKPDTAVVSLLVDGL